MMLARSALLARAMIWFRAILCSGASISSTAVIRELFKCSLTSPSKRAWPVVFKTPGAARKERAPGVYLFWRFAGRLGLFKNRRQSCQYISYDGGRDAFQPLTPARGEIEYARSIPADNPGCAGS